MVEDGWDFERMAREESAVQGQEVGYELDGTATAEFYALGEDEEYEFQGSASAEFYNIAKVVGKLPKGYEKDAENDKSKSSPDTSGEKVTVDKDPHDYASM